MVHIPRWQRYLIAAICVLGTLLLVPSLVGRDALKDLPDWVFKRQIVLGLDLQGGSHLLLEVDIDAIVQEDVNALVDGVRLNLRQAQIGYRNLGAREGKVSFELTDPLAEGRLREALKDVTRTATLESASGGAFVLSFPESYVRERQRAAVEQSIEIVRRRIDETGTSEPIIQRQGRDRIVVQLPGVNDPERIKRLLGKTAKLNFHLLDPASTGAIPGAEVPAGAMLLPSDQVGPDGKPVSYYFVRRRVEVAGDRLIDAQPSFQNNEPVVSFRFDTVGAKKFGDTTQQHVREFLAIVLDNKVISAPVIREPILGGSGIISGNFTTQSAKDLALLLRAGALPAPLLVLEERTVGPSLGADSIAAGEIAGLVAWVLVCAYMMAAYGLFGVFACVALFFNILLIGGFLAFLGAALTLPGIAGVILTIGMAVDANVLIYERIREEVRNGRTPVSAVDSGFRLAMGTIVDSNLTTLFPALLLFGFGSGPIRGFAVTISVGIVTSMFTAIMLTRLLVVLWLRQGRNKVIAL